jgi:NAD(P)-dependent dehydrogenase (short-subunit alcohol dehydrogenase family)
LFRQSNNTQETGMGRPDRGVVVITGGGSGIGLAIADALIRDGWKLLIADLSGLALDTAKAKLGPHSQEALKFVQLDITDEPSVVETFRDCEDGFGLVRGLVNSAGIGRDVPFFDTSAQLFRQILDINLVGTFTVSREVARLMKAHGGGSIVNISSVSGLRGSVGRAAYGASKGGVVTLTQVMACELAADKIRVNAIAPGPVETPLVREMHDDVVRAGWLKHIPQRRYAAPEEIAGAAAFLLDEAKSSFVTGHILNVDGGFMAAGLLPN